MKLKRQRRIGSHVLLNSFVFLFLHVSVVLCPASDRILSGVVTDTEGRPVSNAVVKYQGDSDQTRTDLKGHFQLPFNSSVKGQYITAGKYGFYNGAQKLSSNIDNYRIELKPVPSLDNENYVWLPPLITVDEEVGKTAGESQSCQVCHPAVSEEWRKDAHSNSAENELFFSFFNGKEKNGKSNAGPGYRLDFPKSNGNCAACHIPVLALESKFHKDPNEVQGIAKNGISCDFCHKVSGITIDETGGKPGIFSIKFLRPAEGHQLFFGPYPDVFPGEDSYHPLYTKSHYCAPCHHGKFWDVLAYSEFKEWQESSYRERNIHCQDCHMPPEKTMDRFTLKKEGGILRNPESIPSHVNLGIRDEAFMREAIELKTKVNKIKSVLTVETTVKNVKAGHHYPTGNPMRNMVLLVDVRDKNGECLTMIQGERIPVWGGIGKAEDGNYAGLPGKGFAKVLKDAVLYPSRPRRHFPHEYPSPHWRPTVIESDNRIPAKASDISSYKFSFPDKQPLPITVTVKLIFRRGYKKWLNEKGFENGDMEIAENKVTIRE